MSVTDTIRIRSNYIGHAKMTGVDTMKDIELDNDEIPLLNVYPTLQRLILTQLSKADFKYTKTQFIIFSALMKTDAMNMGQVAHAITASNEQATRAVAPLVEDGYVERYADPSNRTRVFVRLTESGREYILALRRRYHVNLDAILRERLSQEEYLKLRDAVSTAARLLDKAASYIP